MRVLLTTIALLAAISCTEVQTNRATYCRRVLQPETCKELVSRTAYPDIQTCIKTFEADGFCAAPIKNTIGEMNQCVLRLSQSSTLHPDCEKLTHE